MVLAITHVKVATLPDQPGVEINKAEWNDAHALSGTLADAQMADTAVTPGAYTLASVTIDQKGRITAASTGSVTNISGNAATVTTNANLTGAVTSVGNATSLGSFTSANLATAVTDETGSGALVFAVAPTMTGAVAIGANTSSANSLTVLTNINGGITLTSSSGSGPGFNLNQTSGTSFQFFNNGGYFGVYNATSGATPFAINGGTGNAVVQTVSGGVFGFSSNASFPNGASPDTGMSRPAANTVALGNGGANDTTAELRAGNIKAYQAGSGFYVKEGTNACMGLATLVGGTVTVNTTKVTANSRIFITAQTLGTVAVATALAITARTAGTSFTITSAAATDTSTVAWEIKEPA